MKLGIMQPYFFPYIGYFQLISAVDKWIVFDTPQYIRKGWVNRNRVLKENGGVKYIGITPAKMGLETPINEILTLNDDWKIQIIRDLNYYKVVRAPYYTQVVDFLKETFKTEETHLSVLLAHFLRNCCAYLELDYKYEVFSSMRLPLPDINEPGDWAFEISRHLNASEYINPPGGKGLFDSQKFQNAGIKLKFLEPTLTSYDQRNQAFEPGLSIIDVMMFNSPEQIRLLLNQYELI